ncbi:holin [Kitasatospora sp. NPDC048545]|uniref:holin n=1 Tax=Kitasatospora sp. NPDC048545 TaxID=3157208 RepID=UPI0033CF377D
MAQIETKVKAAAAATYLGTTSLLAGLTAVQDHPGLVGWLPEWLAPFVLAIVPTAIAGVAGYQARHTPRPDLVPPLATVKPLEP